MLINLGTSDSVDQHLDNNPTRSRISEQWIFLWTGPQSESEGMQWNTGSLQERIGVFYSQFSNGNSFSNSLAFPAGSCWSGRLSEAISKQTKAFRPQTSVGLAGVPRVSPLLAAARLGSWRLSPRHDFGKPSLECLSVMRLEFSSIQIFLWSDLSII